MVAFTIAAAGDPVGDAASITLTAAVRDRCSDAASITAPTAPEADVVLSYLDILRELRKQGAEVSSALLQAYTADKPQGRREALVEVHARLRRMAATANAALGPPPTRRETPMPSASLRTATVLAALVLAAGCSSTTTTPHTNVQSAAPAGSQAPDDGFHAAPSAPATNSALYAAQTYVRLWARPALNQHAWYAGIRAWVTPAYGQLLASTDPANVPAHGVTGPPRPVSSTATVVVADIPTDTGPVRVTVLNTGGRWLVATARPAAAP